LHNRDGNRIVQFGLRPVAWRLRSAEQPIGQYAGAAARIAVDHQAIGRGYRGGNGLVKRLPLKSRVPAAKHHPLQAAVAGHQLQLRRQERPVINDRTPRIRRTDGTDQIVPLVLSSDSHVFEPPDLC
jgi:hypothetical protein